MSSPPIFTHREKKECEAKEVFSGALTFLALLRNRDRDATLDSVSTTSLDNKLEFKQETEEASILLIGILLSILSVCF